MGLTKTAFIRRAEWLYQTEPLKLILCNGSWDPASAEDTTILPTEVNYGTRVDVTISSLVWNATLNKLDTELTCTFNPPADVTFNRVVILRGDLNAGGYCIFAREIASVIAYQNTVNTITFTGDNFAT